MFDRTSEVKVLRDPIHGYIHVDYEVIWQCINADWMQRLRRIRQLGGSFVVYHTADHSRFGHSLGVYEIVRRMVTEVPDIANTLNEKEKVTVMLAGLLHDVGHGPYSHAFESVIHSHHEEYTCRIIEENTSITGILENACEGLSHDVADIIRHQHPNPLLNELVSSQLDADRMDYLLRDAYFTGTKYGEFDLERILRTLRVSNGHIVIKESGVYAVEYYIMARYHMYWQVYYHPTARSYELLLMKFFTRLRDLHRQGKSVRMIPEFEAVLKGRKIRLEDYFRLDECACSYAFSQLTACEDPILRDLAARILNRDLFEYREASAANMKQMKALLKDAGMDIRYYLGKDEVDQKPYVPYSGENGSSIRVRMHTGEIRELGRASNIVYSLVHGPQHSDVRIFFPKEFENR